MYQQFTLILISECLYAVNNRNSWEMVGIAQNVLSRLGMGQVIYACIRKIMKSARLLECISSIFSIPHLHHHHNFFYASARTYFATMNN